MDDGDGRGVGPDPVRSRSLHLRPEQFLTPEQAVRDRELRDALEDRGHRVQAIRFDEPFEEQLARHPETFGAR